MTNFSEDLEDLLEAERDIEAPTAAARESLLARMQPLLVVPVALAAGASSAATATEASGSAVSGLFKAKIASAVVSAALFGGVVGAAAHSYLASPPAVPSATQPLPPSPPEPLSKVAPEPVQAVPEPLEAAPSAMSEPAPTPSTARKERPRASGSLRAERLLLETASAALMRGDAEAALLALRQHAARFPNGNLAAERDALLERARAAQKAR